MPRYEYQWTDRKEAAALRRQRREREAYPLFADEIAREQPSMGKVRADRIARADRFDAQQRASQAKHWRTVRARLAALPEVERLAVLAFWNGHRFFPGEPLHLLYVIRQYESVGIDALT